ncbi:MAG: hypothetical protein IPL36_03770 [Nigerium sp.]|nr:hypothetical protein [Nigerium sp.]
MGITRPVTTVATAQVASASTTRSTKINSAPSTPATIILTPRAWFRQQDAAVPQGDGRPREHRDAERGSSASAFVTNALVARIAWVDDQPQDRLQGVGDAHGLVVGGGVDQR